MMCLADDVLVLAEIIHICKSTCKSAFGFNAH